MILQWVRLKCRIYILLYGSEGISMIIEKLAQPFLVPVLVKYGAKIGSGTRILRGLTLHGLKNQEKPLFNLVLGKNVYIGRNVLIDLNCQVVLEDDSALGAGCQVWTHVGDFTYDFSDYHEKRDTVKIGKGVICWSGVLICPGVKIGDYSRASLGSVIIKDVESGIIVGGVPAKMIKRRDI
jgi:acetyltransferase-like isoleucine patch superfamily enzyme